MLTVVNGVLVAFLLVSGVACMPQETETPQKIVLLAPFEGRYREIGYDAFYAIQLAYRDSERTDMNILAVDDGGSVQSAVERARAIALDPFIQAVIVLGYDAADESVQIALGDLPVIIVGNWMVEAQAENVWIVTSPDIETLLSYSERLDVTDAAQVRAPFMGGDVFSLRGFRSLRDDMEGITVVSGGRMPSDDFREQIFSMFQFADEPGILSMAAYDAFRVVINQKTPALPPTQYFTFNNESQLIPNYTIK